jgi:hypothetical protein
MVKPKGLFPLRWRWPDGNIVDRILMGVGFPWARCFCCMVWKRPQQFASTHWCRECRWGRGWDE